MEILFVSSGNTQRGITPIVYNQGVSLRSIGHDVAFFTIKGKGLKGYIRNIFILRSYLKRHSYDVIHAHYSLSGMVASLAGASPLVVSLMGSDVKASSLIAWGISLFKKIFWKKVIVKSKDMKEATAMEEVKILPNGVDFDTFKPISKKKSLEKTGWCPYKKHILFAGNPRRKVKNYALAEKAFNCLRDESVEMHPLINIPNPLMPYYFNAADVVILTSLWEGSPNVIKEAMACNCKIVAVDVGDIRELISDTYGCFVTRPDEKELASKLKEALRLDASKTNGRDQIAHLNAKVIAEKLTTIYKDVIDD
ncbi:glycosyltransferase [Aquimarina hainanensis]|uniref:Glycosyltransferase n=1 Tax=Aquimarina hainanensis TaxID=1578017 RepID=A0ABW5N8I9_9FLAO|nr:glycosyltransferase [Aquimarina sp. TRL1]QKX03910.1 glycosyltransferase [Aquimarina sp. TRL1]